MPQPHAILRDGSRWTPGTPFPADYPGAIVIPAHPSNFGYTADRTATGEPRVCEPRGICLHTPEEKADEIEVTPTWFQNPDANASTHYYHDNDGDVYQMVPETVGPWANGVQNKPYPPWARAGYPLNLQTVSTEIEGCAASIHNTITRAQWGSLIDWLRFELHRYGIPATAARILGHYQVSSQRTDPGVILMERIWKEIEGGDMDFARHVTVADWFTNRDLQPGPDGKMRAVSDLGLPPGAKAVALEVILDPTKPGDFVLFDGGTPDGSDVGSAGRVRSSPGYGVIWYVGLGDDGSLRFRVENEVRVTHLRSLGFWR